MQAAALQSGHETRATAFKGLKDINRPNSQQHNDAGQVSFVLLICLCCGVQKSIYPISATEDFGYGLQ